MESAVTMEKEYILPPEAPVLTPRMVHDMKLPRWIWEQVYSILFDHMKNDPKGEGWIQIRSFQEQFMHRTNKEFSDVLLRKHCSVRSTKNFFDRIAWIDCKTVKESGILVKLMHPGLRRKLAQKNGPNQQQEPSKDTPKALEAAAASDSKSTPATTNLEPVMQALALVPAQDNELATTTDLEPTVQAPATVLAQDNESQRALTLALEWHERVFNEILVYLARRFPDGVEVDNLTASYAYEHPESEIRRYHSYQVLRMLQRRTDRVDLFRDENGAWHVKLLPDAAAFKKMEAAAKRVIDAAAWAVRDYRCSRSSSGFRRARNQYSNAQNYDQWK